MKLTKTLSCFLLFGFSSNANAELSCDDVIKMLRYNLPESTIVNAMKSAKSMPSDMVVCLQKNGATQNIINVALQKSVKIVGEEKSSVSQMYVLY